METRGVVGQALLLISGEGRGYKTCVVRVSELHNLSVVITYQLNVGFSIDSDQRVPSNVVEGMRLSYSNISQMSSNIPQAGHHTYPARLRFLLCPNIVGRFGAKGIIFASFYVS